MYSKYGNIFKIFLFLNGHNSYIYYSAIVISSKLRLFVYLLAFSSGGFRVAIFSWYIFLSEPTYIAGHTTGSWMKEI